MTEHKRRMETELGRTPELAELFLRTHRHKKDSRFVDKKAEDSYEKFSQRKEQLADASSQVDSSTQPSDYDVWMDTVGGVKKGRLYGFGSERPSVSSARPTSNTQHSVGTSGDVDQMVSERVAALREEMSQEIERREQRVRDKMAELMTQRLAEQQSQMTEQLSILFQQYGLAQPPPRQPPQPPSD